MKIIHFLLILMVLFPVIYADDINMNSNENKINYIVDKVLDSSLNTQIRHIDVNISSNVQIKDLNRADLLSVNEAKILIDKEGSEVRLHQLQKEIAQKKEQVNYLVEESSNVSNVQYVDDNSSNMVNRLNKLKFVDDSLSKLSDEIKNKNVSNLSDDKIAEYYLDLKYQYLILVKFLDDMNTSLVTLNDSINETYYLDEDIARDVNNYNAFMLQSYLRKLNIYDPSLIDEVKKGEVDKAYLNETLREKIGDMEDYEIDIILYRLSYKEMLDYERVLSLYEWLNINTDIEKVSDILLN